MQPPPLTGHHRSVPFDTLCIDMCTYETSEIRTSPYVVTNGVLIIEVPLYKTVYCGPNGVFIVVVSCTVHTLHVIVLLHCHGVRVSYLEAFSRWLFQQAPIE